MTRSAKAGMIVGVGFFLALWGLDTFSALAAGKKPESPAAGAQARVEMAAQAHAAGSASITGQVTLSGAAPAPQKIKMAADPVCLQQHAEGAMSQEVVAQGGKLQYVLVYVKEGVQGSYPAPQTPVVLNQTGCLYEPHLFGIQAGQPLEIRNSDATLHNINCMAKSNKKFNIAQPTKGMKTTKTFDQPEVVVPFKCNVHPWMNAYAGVFAHPFFAVTDANGSFSIQGLPAGTYTLEAWQEKLGTKSQKVTVAEGESKSLNFSF